MGVKPVPPYPSETFNFWPEHWQILQFPLLSASHPPSNGPKGYGDELCVQPSSGLDDLLWPICDALNDVLPSKVIIIRQDGLGRRRERAPLRREVFKGSYQGPSELREQGVSFAVDLLNGQKTGWYYDQRANRELLVALKPQRVLDLYSYAPWRRHGPKNGK